MKIEGMTALVTGGASGIGRATVFALAKAGAKTIHLLDINRNLGTSVAAEINAELSPKPNVVIFHQCDVTKESEVAGIYQTAANNGTQVDAVINCAGILQEQNWQRMIDINLKGLVTSSYAAIEHMGEHNGGKGGVIVNMASISGVTIWSNVPVYGATKHAVVSFTRALSSSNLFSRHGVRVNCVCPSFTDTPLLDTFYADPNWMYKPEWAPKMRVSSLIRPEEIASVVMELIRDDDLNGQVMLKHRDQEAFNVDFSSMNRIKKPQPASNL